MKITAYIDETGTHDRKGQLPGSEMVGLCGLVAWREDWAVFCEDWQRILNKYSVPYFHYCEWSQAVMVARGMRKEKRGSKPKPYAGLSLSKLNDFVEELTEIAGSGNKVAIGGLVHTAAIHQAVSSISNPESAPAGGNPYLLVIQEFFRNIAQDIQSAWPHWKEPVTLYFDQNDDAEWNAAIHAEFIKLRRNDSRFSEIAFVDKKIFPHLPMQAADLFAYRFRQLSINIQAGRGIDPSNKLDNLMMKSTFKQFDSAGGKPSH